jgi:glycine C-acetyltransferase
VHKDLEEEISKFFGTEDAILYTSCFDANTGLFETILKEGDAIFSDELNHASIIDGIRLCKAERFRYKHSDMADLESKLQEVRSRLHTTLGVEQTAQEMDQSAPPRRLMIATDGVFSMDGEMAKLVELNNLAEKYGALLMVDDSHGSGVLGERGRGRVEGFTDMGMVDILTSTFGKALGGAGGGFTAGRKEIIEILRQRSRTTLFSNSLPPVIAHNALYVLQNFDSKFSYLLKQLIENTGYFRSKIEKLGFTLGGDGSHPITPIMLMEEKLASEMASALFKKDIYVRGFTYPVVPKGKARIRVQISAAHTKEQMDKAVKAFEQVGKAMKIIN